jgi:thiosulfate/3-mercaptopyruvate sulfurtransferase
MHEEKNNLPVKLVSTEWLHERLGQTAMTIIDVQPNIHDYILEHIPGAVYLNEGILRMPVNGIPGCYVPPIVIEPVLRAIGLREDRPVLVYTGTGAFSSGGDGLGQTMMAYSLARFGHHDVYVLDGGLDQWKVECRKLVKDFPGADQSVYKVDVNSDYFIGYEEFKSSKDNNDVLVLDARPPAMYEGQGPWAKPGHIPGAVSLPWASLMHQDNRALLKTRPQVDAILQEHRVTRDKTILCYCGTGREATNEFLLLKFYLGYPRVRLYEGSFTEWVAHADSPTVTGKNPCPQAAAVTK